MGSIWIRWTFAAALLLGAGTLAQTSHWRPTAPGDISAPPLASAPEPVREGGSAASPAAASPGQPRAPEIGTGDALAHDGTADGADAEPNDPDLPSLTRAEFQAFARALVDAASEGGAVAEVGAAPAALAAAAAIPTPILLDNFNTPMFATALPGDERIFVVERAGRIRILFPSLPTRTFLDISSKVGTAGEGGMLGLAFPPDHDETGLFYVYYTDTSSPGRSVLSRFDLLDGDPNEANPGSEKIVLRVNQIQTNHNGGTIAFSPIDDFLYWGLGDGGGALGRDAAQAPDSLLGKMLRIDVSGGPNTTYSIPPSNPFVGTPGVRNEIWSVGLRNPFRFSFDALLGTLWIGDVGEQSQEEIDREPPGISARNYEWPRREGNLPPSSSTLLPGTTPALPELVYNHNNSPCDSVTGGILYRGPDAGLSGRYFFADYCRNQVWQYDPASTFDEVDDEVTDDFVPATDGIVAFGEDGFGAMLVVTISGAIYRVGATGSECDPDDDVDDDGDGDTDFPDDEGCSSANDPSEWDPDVPCDDGIDNDEDGLTDSADADCTDLTPDGELPEPGPGDGGGSDDSSGGCGLGFELVLVVPLLRWARSRRRARLAA